MFESKMGRQLLVSVPIWLATEYAICLLLAFIFSDSNIWGVALAGLGMLYLARMASWAINSVLSIIFYYFEKKARIDAVVAAFYAQKLPVTEAMVSGDSAIEVFEDLINLDSVEDRIKLFASRSLGELAGIKASNRTVLYIQTQFVLEAAIERYVAEKNARKD
ncbi:MAG: hypothetical protein KGQ41_04910 [Alphaproteobacteria bacterium]|nr:hypothetical protein [Alphaproteobacteria bacterium]